MKALTDPVLVILLLTNLMILGSSSLSACIRLVAVQGVVLGLLPLVIEGAATPRLLVLAGGSMVLKGFVFPWLLSRALREAAVRREVEPVVGYTTSLIIGVAALCVALWLSSRLPLPPGLGASQALPLALFMIQVGLFLIVSRNKALLQVLGYLVLENGIYAFGVGLALREHLLVELGVLLDVFVAVFVMGIIIFHISREFDHIDVDQLSKLKDWHR
jgi:hydrogenase-4 component E